MSMEKRRVDLVLVEDLLKALKNVGAPKDIFEGSLNGALKWLMEHWGTKIGSLEDNEEVKIFQDSLIVSEEKRAALILELEEVKAEKKSILENGDEWRSYRQKMDLKQVDKEIKQVESEAKVKAAKIKAAGDMTVATIHASAKANQFDKLYDAGLKDIIPAFVTDKQAMITATIEDERGRE